jgi:2-methylcitrate dehydratase PrpD
MSESTVTTIFAEVCVKRTFDQLPTEAVHQAKRLVLDHIGVGLAGSQRDSGGIVADFALSQGGPAEASVFGRSGRATALHAAFANAISSHSVELDDVDEEALFHHAPPVVAAARAVAEMMHASGEEFLTAVVTGSEIMTRLSKATNPQLRDRAFHTTPTCGVFGAAAAAGVLLGLTDTQLVSAFGLAGAQASGLMEMYGTSMQKRFNPGPAARNGVTAALLAREGFTGADTIIDGQRGFGAAFSGYFDRNVFLDGLGTTIPFTVEYKPYSCARPIHNAIDCMLELREQGLTADQVDTIVCRRHPSWAHYHQIPRPGSFHEAQVSLPYSAALALVEGNALPAQYAGVGMGDEAVMEVSEKIAIETDSSLERGVSCHFIVTTKDGRQLQSVVDYPLGSIQRPLDDEALAAKFVSLSSETIGADRARDAVRAVFALESMSDVNDLSGLIVPEEAK